MLSHLPQVGAAAGGSTGKVGRELQQWIDDGDYNSSSSQAARDLFYHRAVGGGRGGGESPAGKAAFTDGADDDVAGAPPREVEVSNLILWPHPSSLNMPGDIADNSVNRSEGVLLIDGTQPQSKASNTTDGGCSTVGSSSISSAATSAVLGRAPKLLDFFNLNDEGSSREFREARNYLEEFREFNLDRAILQEGLGATGERIAALDLPLVARYTFQVGPLLPICSPSPHHLQIQTACRGNRLHLCSHFPPSAVAQQLQHYVHNMQGLCHRLRSSTNLCVRAPADPNVCSIPGSTAARP